MCSQQVSLSQTSCTSSPPGSVCLQWICLQAGRNDLPSTSNTLHLGCSQLSPALQSPFSFHLGAVMLDNYQKTSIKCSHQSQQLQFSYSSVSRAQSPLTLRAYMYSDYRFSYSVHIANRYKMDFAMVMHRKKQLSLIVWIIIDQEHSILFSFQQNFCLLVIYICMISLPFLLIYILCGPQIATADPPALDYVQSQRNTAILASFQFMITHSIYVYAYEFIT